MQINRIRHWMNIGMHVNEQFEERNNFEEIIACQNRIKVLLSNLMDRCRERQKLEMMNNFDKWGKYDESMLLKPGRNAMIRNNIYNLHCALVLEEKDDELEKLKSHVKDLRNLASEDEQKGKDLTIYCNLCEVFIHGIPKLRGHLYTTIHKENEIKYGII